VDGERSAVKRVRPTIRQTIALALLAICSMAHVGSPDTFYTGLAGPYPVRVSVRLPGVIPGLAQISVRLVGASPDAIRRVTVQAIQWDVGSQGAPPPDPARPVPGDAELYAAELWLMVPTSYRVHVAVDGRDGQGTAVVPVLALATAQREMPRALGIVLAFLGIFLAIGLLTIIGAAARESTVAPGARPGARDRRRARTTMTVGAVLLALAGWGGWAWWNAEADGYAQFRLHRPFAADAAVESTAGRRTLTLAIRDERWPPSGTGITRYNALMPDHGKLMHMFLIREPQLDAFAHVHPIPKTPAAEAFSVSLPPLPAGTYRVYGDIVHESGYAQTISARVTLGDSGEGTPGSLDSDDSYLVGGAVGEGDSPTVTTSDGGTISWERGSAPLVAREEALLTFSARGPDGAPSLLEPYMGMLGHAAVASEDGTVFAHLHPSGSISMAALQKFSAGVGTPAPHHSAPASTVTIPYGFPKAGRYRLWVQMKRAGAVVTAPFAVTVE
jgi:hypothetical protein